MSIEVAAELARRGYCAVPAAVWPDLNASGRDELMASWHSLAEDAHMADGGRYRFRRYSRLLWSDGQLTEMDGNSIYQELADNPLNGGVQRTFEPLLPAVLSNPYLQAVIQEDARALGLRGDWRVGLHCVRILARPRQPGLPTPEGIHRDAEAYTVQHLIRRERVRGGVFTGYDELKQPVFHWLQLHPWDTLYFQGKLWHSASPVESEQQGHRDILLVDFDESPRS